MDAQTRAGEQAGQIDLIRGGLSSTRLARAGRVTSRAVARGDIAGSVSLVYRKGHEAYFDAQGFADLSAKTAMRRDTIFYLASMTKPVTAVAVMLLVEDGTLRLDDPVDRWLPELANRQVLDDPAGPLDRTHPAARSITVRDLLTYRMGIGAMETSPLVDTTAPIAVAAEAMRNPDWSEDEWMAQLGALPLAAEPGGPFLYNIPSIVSGILVSRASGIAFDQFLQARLFDPLNMPDTGFWVPERNHHRVAVQYQPGEARGELVPADAHMGGALAAPKLANGAGGLSSTLDDYLRFARMMLGRGEVDGVRILSRRSVELMTRDHMSPTQHEERFSGMAAWKDTGFGFGMSVITRQMTLGPSVGSFSWGGRSGVRWIADPQEELIVINLIQILRGGVQYQMDFQQMVYQAIVD
jgi:CubicO group peptidase (beta-lactamase class C family)